GAMSGPLAAAAGSGSRVAAFRSGTAIPGDGGDAVLGSRAGARAGLGSGSRTGGSRTGGGSKSMIWMLGGLAAAAGLAGVGGWLGPNLLRLSSGPGGVVARNGAPNGTSSAPGASTAPTSLIPPLASASRIALQDNDGVIGLDATGALHMLKSGATAPNASTA